ncbi:HlyD family secretion protein [Phenylobacterium sp.]|uniref:HlyD family secretion protein n=1 Tax=Phenylobacterium sp. TaxID=1871053 RepID=UPI0017E36607|nr:efflux RND transporter periplasmic adaptor subunit [Phenylobacterium sp.]MBA4793964.1 efflux RND transporter periplasmic adaptor subunit [Phenylobacterium sp.]MBC7167792.1 efflux RND transporter periplasmic adaptor subunit [Phenylobacterium sp.]
MPAFFRRKTVWFAAAAVLVLGGGAFVLASQAQDKKEAEAAQAAKAAPQSPFVAIANGKADVEGGLIQVAARSAGIVRQVLVQEGDQVSQGQILARLEDDEPRLSAQRAAAEVEQARAQIALTQVEISTANREYERLKALAPSNFVAGQRLDQAQDAIRSAEARLRAQRAAVATAEARLAEANYNLELTVIRAPADGTIVRRYANPGSGASTLNVSTMFDLEPAGQRIVRAEIAEGALPHVEVGQTVQIASEADPAETYQGKVIRRAAVFGARKLVSDDPTERTDDRVVEVVVSADGAPFLVGQRVLVKFLREGAQLAQAS